MKILFFLFFSIISLGVPAQNIGINTPNPSNTLSVNGSVDVVQKLGIGTTAPAGELHVKSLNNSQSILDQQQTTGGSSGGSNAQWQSFTAGITGQLTKIELSIASPTSATSAPGTIKIYEGEGNTGTLLSTTAVTFQNPLDFKTFTLATSVNVSAGNKYTIEFSTPTVTKGWVSSNNSSTYTGGTTNLAGLNANLDFLFKTYVYAIMDALIVNNGNVGIGTTAPQAPLHISGTAITTSNLARAYFNVGTGSNINQNTASSGFIQVQADGYFWANAGGFVATSDARIKNIMGKTDNEKDLEILKKIEITNYTYKDTIRNHAGLQKKVVAQQLRSVYPMAVSLHTDMVPSLFELAKKVTNSSNNSTIETNSAHGFATGDFVKIILENGQEIKEKVLLTDAHSFTIAHVVAGKVFVYGKKVNDLHTVDYDALSTLNISATQALLKRIEVLELENLALKTEVQSRITALESKFEAKEFSKIVSK